MEKECAGRGDRTRGRLHAKRTRFRSSYRAQSIITNYIMPTSCAGRGDRTRFRSSYRARSIITNYIMPTSCAGRGDRTRGRLHAKRTRFRSSYRARSIITNYTMRTSLKSILHLYKGTKLTENCPFNLYAYSFINHPEFIFGLLISLSGNSHVYYLNTDPYVVYACSMQFLHQKLTLN